MAQKNSLQFFILSLIVGIILLAGTFSFTSLTKAVLNPDSFTHFKENSWIGPIDVSGLDKEQSLQLLSKKTNEWKQKNQMASQFLFESAKMDPETLTFEVQSSVNTALNGKKNELQVTLNGNLWNGHLLELGFTGQEDTIDFVTFKQDILSFAHGLQSNSGNFNLTSYINRKQTGVFEIAQATTSLSLSDASASSWIRKHSTILVEPNQSVSLNEIFISEPEGLYSDEFKTILASTMYKAALESPFQIFERHISQTNPFKIQAGFEALIDENKDFVIENVYGFPLTIETTQSGNQLIVKISGPDVGIEVDLDPLERKVLPYRVQIQTIEKSVPQKTDKGIEGVEVNVSRTVFLNREKKATFHVANDLYFPKHEVQYRHDVETSELTPPTSNNSSTESGGNNSVDGTPNSTVPSGGSGGTSIPAPIIPPGGTSTESDLDEILKEDQTKTTK